MTTRSTIRPITPTTSGASTSIANQMSMPALVAGDRGVAAEHHELAVREVDDPHHPEHDRQPRAGQREEGDHVQDLEEDDGGVVHGRLRSRSSPTLAARSSPRTACSRSGSSPGRRTAAVSLGGRCLNVCLIVSFWPLTSITLDVERRVVGLRLDRDECRPARRSPMPDSIALSSLSRSSEPAFLTASAHSLMPWYCETAISCTILVSPKRLPQRARKSLFAGVVVFLAVVAGDQDAVALGGRQREVLVADAEGGRGRAGSSCSCPTPPTGGRTTGARRRPAPRHTEVGLGLPGSWRSSSRSRRRRAGRSRSAATVPPRCLT